MRYEIETAKLPESEAVAIRAAIPMEQLPQFFGAAYQELAKAVDAGGAVSVGPPFARYYTISPRAVDVEAVMPTNKAVSTSGRVRAIHLDASQAAVVRHVGPYDAMRPAYQAIEAWMHEHGKKAAEAPREVYLTSPSEVPNPAEWVTLVEQPISAT